MPTGPRSRPSLPAAKRTGVSSTPRHLAFLSFGNTHGRPARRRSGLLRVAGGGRDCAPDCRGDPRDLMAANGWLALGRHATLLRRLRRRSTVDPTLARRVQESSLLGVDGLGMVESAPDADFPVDGHPRLTTQMTARHRLVGVSGSTARHRQIGNAPTCRQGRWQGHHRRLLAANPMSKSQTRLLETGRIPKLGMS